MTEAKLYKELGKRRPEFVRPYIFELMELSEKDDNRVVRIHARGAIKTAGLLQ